MRHELIFEVAVVADDEGEVDPAPIRDAITDGLRRAEDEGYLTALDNETTTVEQYHVRHLKTQPNGTLDLRHGLQTPKTAEQAGAQMQAAYARRQEAEALEARAEQLWLAAFLIEAFAGDCHLMGVVGEENEEGSRLRFYVESKGAENARQRSYRQRVEDTLNDTCADFGWMERLVVGRGDAEWAKDDPSVLSVFLANGCRWPRL